MSARSTISAAAWCWRTPRCSVRPDAVDDDPGTWRTGRRVGLAGYASQASPTSGFNRLSTRRGNAAAQVNGRGIASRSTPQGLSVRTNFNALALFSPSVRTDAAGVAHVNFDLPDNLTRYRVMAVAADDGGRVRRGRVDAHRAAPVADPAVAAPVRQLRRPVRAARSWSRTRPTGRWSPTSSRKPPTSRSPTRTAAG